MICKFAKKKGIKMATVIKIQDKPLSDVRQTEEPKNELLRILSYLPRDIGCEISNASERGRIEEIRLRAERQIYLTLSIGGEVKNISLSRRSVLSAEELSDILCRMCGGSMYAYSESMLKGYISLGTGVRVGVCGRASVEDGKILGVCNICALNIRLPSFFARIPPSLLAAVRESIRQGEGVLIYSLPSGGKTTLLRMLALALSEGTASALRVAVIDTREELMPSFGGTQHSLDVLSAYPHAEGIRIATEYMNPQLIICDEIGSEEDALAILHAQNRGVPLIATAHASDISGLLRRRGIAELHKSHIFGIYAFIKKAGDGSFEYKLDTHREVEDEYFRCGVADIGRSGNSTSSFEKGAK